MTHIYYCTYYQLKALKPHGEGAQAGKKFTIPYWGIQGPAVRITKIWIINCCGYEGKLSEWEFKDTSCPAAAFKTDFTINALYQ